MADAWAAARRIAAVVFTALVIAAGLEVLENAAHITSDFLHVLVIPVAFLVALIVVHGFRVFERWGF